MPAAALTLLILLVALMVSHTRAYHFRVVTIREAPFDFVNDNPDTGEKEYTGYIVQFADQLFGRLYPGNWSYTLYEVPDGNYGTKNKDGTWNGLIGEVRATPHQWQTESDNTDTTTFSSFIARLLVPIDPRRSGRSRTGPADDHVQQDRRCGLFSILP